MNAISSGQEEGIMADLYLKDQLVLSSWSFLGPHQVGHKDVATGRGDFSL